MKKLKGRLILDAVLSILLIAVMFMEVTGVFVHEIIGFTLFAGIVAHLILERKWIMRTLKRATGGEMSSERTVKSVVALLLVVAMVVMMVTSILISTILRNAGLSLLPYSAYGACVKIHTVCAYAICALCLVHLVIHWKMIAGVLHVPYDPSRRKAINTGFGVVTGLGVLALSISLADALDAFEVVKGYDDKNPRGKDRDHHSDDFGKRGGSGESDGDSSGNSKKGLDSGSGSGSGESGSTERRHHGPKGEGRQRGDAEGKGFRKGDRGAANGNSSSDSSSESGICTLCKRRCSLSAPECNWPYEQGLIK